MDYYNEIKSKLLDNEIYSMVKDYSKERHRVITYFEIGRLLYEAGSVYGEDIIEYALKNDILGFIDDERFFEIIKISSNMDELLEHLRIIKYLNVNNEDLNIIFERCTKEEMIELSKKLLELKSSFKNIILELFNQIIEEYNNCTNPKISKKDLLNKLNEFVTSNDYNIISYMVFENGTISEQVQTIISKFSNEKIMTK